MFLDLAPTCRKCMHPKNCTAPTQERVRLPGGLGRTGNHSAILMARVKLTVGWKATPVPVSHGDVGGGIVIVAPVWRWFGLPPVKVNADDMVLCNDTFLEEWRPTPLTGHGMMSIFSMCIAHLKKAENKGFALAINIQEDATVYASFNPEGNIWTDYFFQPHEVSHPSLICGGGGCASRGSASRYREDQTID